MDIAVAIAKYLSLLTAKYNLKSLFHEQLTLFAPLPEVLDHRARAWTSLTGRPRPGATAQACPAPALSNRKGGAVPTNDYEA
eukprot:6199587-Pleurochrysis_carterae.AAC.1